MGAYHAGPVFGTTGLFGSFYDSLGDDPAVRPSDLVLLELAGHALLDQASKSKRNFGDDRRGDRGLDCLFGVGGENWMRELKRTIVVSFV